MPIGKLEPFNLNSKQWPAYVRRVNQYILLNNINAELRVAMLITVVGDATYSLMCDLCSPELPENKSYEVLVKLVEEHLEPKRSEIAERHVFRLRRQRAGEPLMEYLQALKHLAATCNFGKCKTCSTLEENLRDQFVSGLANDAMRSRIFAKKVIRYKEAVELALALEAAEKHAEVSGSRGPMDSAGAGGGDAGDSLHFTRGQRGRGRGLSGGAGAAGAWRGAGTSASGDGGPRAGPGRDGSPACWRCGKAHRAERCRYAHYNCDECNKRGHLKVMCAQLRGGKGRISDRHNYFSDSSDDMFDIEVAAEDKPCMSQRANNSYICVCNATYCDEITRDQPTSGQYFIYVTSKDGYRLQKTSGNLHQVTNIQTGAGTTTLELDPSKRFQYIEGFGGAVTDSAAMNYLSLPDPQLRAYLIESYFGSKGIEYNMIRVPIGGCDFSVRPYAYNEWPINDVHLTNFSLSSEDYYYKIPMILDAFKAATAPLHLVASTWSPPLWMKNPSTLSGLTRLRKEYFQTYADYHLKFIESYANYGIPIWAVTTTNEPLSGVMSLGHNNRLGWSTKSMGQWIANNLGPTLQNSNYNVKILIGDDQRFTVPLWFNVVVSETEALKYIDGVAVHFYFDDITAPEVLTTAMKDHPDKFIIYTESCTGVQESPSVLLGSWDRAVQYIHNIIEDLNYNTTGWVDWNLCLDEDGGPNHIDNYVDSPIIVFPERGEFVKQPMFYGMAHFSKFMPRGSQRIHVREINSSSTIEHVSVVTPENNIVTVLHNNQDSPHQVNLNLNGQQANLMLEPNSISTVEFPNH